MHMTDSTPGNEVEKEHNTKAKRKLQRRRVPPAGGARSENTCLLVMELKGQEGFSKRGKAFCEETLQEHCWRAEPE